MPRYHHRQVGALLMLALGLTAAGTLAILLGPGRTGSIPGPAAIALVAVVLCLIFFATLTVDVSDRDVVVWFGPGVIRRTFRLAEIRDARAVRNRWWYGWGVRLTPFGWLFNVAGLDAVELELADGRKFRIGTDEPQVLLGAIRAAVNQAMPPTTTPPATR